VIPENYYYEMINTAHDLNKSYGYLFWLNGKESFMLPQTEFVFPGSLLKNAPGDVYAALGKNGQSLNVSPSKGIILVRMGAASDQGDGEVAGQLNNAIWKFLNQVMGETSIVQDELGDKFAIKPNPASNFIEIYSHKYQDASFAEQVEIYNVIGECLVKSEVRNFGYVRLDISKLPVGIYILKIGEIVETFAKIND